MLFKNKINNPAIAFGYVKKGLKMILRPELRRFLWVPVLINILLYSSALFVGYYYINELLVDFIPSWLQWLSWILWPLYFVSFFIIVFFTFTVLANILAAPFYGKLAAKTQALVGDHSIAVVEPSIVKVMMAETRRAGYFVLRSLPILLLFLVPVVNLVAPFVWALFGAWAMALEYLAYPLENEGMLFSEQKKWVKSMRLGALGFGGAAMLGLSIPLLNLVVAPAAVIGATLYVNDARK